MADPHLLCLKYSLGVDRDLSVEIKQGIDCALWDINGPNLEEYAYTRDGDELSVSCRTRELGIALGAAAVSTRDFGELTNPTWMRSGIDAT
jgi:kojibiose phosphorylase/nigerose phosphorylase